MHREMNALYSIFVTFPIDHLLMSLLKADAEENAKKEIMMKKNKTKKMTTKS